MTELETLLRTQWVKRDGSPDESMVKYCLKSSTYLDTGKYYLNIGDKPSIDSDIWYDDETEKPEINFDTFRNYNMRHNAPDNLDEMAASGRVHVWIYTNYSTDRTGGKLKGWTTTHRGEEPRHLGDYRQATPAEVEAIRKGLAEMTAAYEKRLASYWKRYSSKVSTRGYWANR